VSTAQNRPLISLKALRELGPRKLGLYTWYQIALRTGYLQYKTRGKNSPSLVNPAHYKLHPVIKLPKRNTLVNILGEDGQLQLLTEADEIVDGEVRLFGGEPVPLKLKPEGPLGHWTAYELDNRHWGVEDVKYLWEPARFCWVYTLGRAYHLTGDERYPDTFWRNVDLFLDANRPNRGPHWASAQEVALRIIAFTFAGQVFRSSIHSSYKRLSRLGEAIADHANRIPSTLTYARAQNNNHLLSEAAGLFTAGMILRDHPTSTQWREMGLKWFNQGIETQIADDGTYTQQSTNYHRMMLQLGLWMNSVLLNQGQAFKDSTIAHLAAGTRWLLTLLDQMTGGVPNLGPNDGAYIMPLTVCPFGDYRPVLQAASTAFVNQRSYKSGIWDEMGLWFQNESVGNESQSSKSKGLISPPHVLRTVDGDSWAYLRATTLTDRPGHADQLHLDLWWHGHNIAQDAGTYRYNASPPWDNALTTTAVHNTITVNAQDQMTRAGRFLYLDWAQAEVLTHEHEEDGFLRKITVQHDGYQKIGALHQRTVEVQNNGWRVLDRVVRTRNSDHPDSMETRLHWLLPDWPWEVDKAQNEGFKISLNSPHGVISLTIQGLVQESQSPVNTPNITITRAGELVYGTGTTHIIRGWASPTYGNKIPALSITMEISGKPPILYTSHWVFPGNPSKMG
jgi:hypothetical protein